MAPRPSIWLGSPLRRRQSSSRLAAAKRAWGLAASLSPDPDGVLRQPGKRAANGGNRAPTSKCDRSRSPPSPEHLSRDGVGLAGPSACPQSRFTRCDDTHAAARIASKLDVVQIARRLGHGRRSSPADLRPPFRGLGQRRSSRNHDRFATAKGMMLRVSGANFWVAGVQQLLKVLDFLGRRRGRVAEGGGLLNRYTLSRRIEGSNPSVSAITHNRVALHFPT